MPQSLQRTKKRLGSLRVKQPWKPSGEQMFFTLLKLTSSSWSVSIYQCPAQGMEFTGSLFTWASWQSKERYYLLYRVGSRGSNVKISPPKDRTNANHCHQGKHNCACLHFPSYLPWLHKLVRIHTNVCKFPHVTHVRTSTHSWVTYKHNREQQK